MSTVYKGIKIETSILIVEKYCCGNDTPPEYHWNEETIPQGYVVLDNNPKMLASAMSWARTYKFSKNENGEFIKDEHNRWATEDVEGTVHTYENGKFKLEVYDSADRSSQGGKLSFWTVIVTAPDGKQFRIGVDANILLELLRYNTFEKGKCLSSVWLGREGTKVGAYTDTMPDFAQAIKDEEFRNRRPTVKYSVGDVLRTKKEVLIYMGEHFEKFSLQNFYEKRTCYRRTEYVARNRALVVDTTPVVSHYYWEVSDEKYTKFLAGEISLDELFIERWRHIRIEPKKLSRIVDGHIEIINDDFWSIEENYYQDKVNRHTGYVQATKPEAYEYAYRVRELQQAELELQIVKTHRILAEGKHSQSEVKAYLESRFDDFVIPQVTTDTVEGTWTSAVIAVVTQEDYIVYLKRKYVEAERACGYYHYSFKPEGRNWDIDFENS